MMTTSTTSVTSDQKHQCMQIADNAVRRAFHEVPLNRESIQRFIESSEKFQACIIDCVRDLSLPNHFANEEIGSNYTYPQGYNAHPTLEENFQDLGKELNILRASFPELECSNFDGHFVYRIRKGEIVLPEGAERWTLIPSWEKIAQTYGKAVTKALDIIEPWRDHNRTEAGYLRQQARTENMFRVLHEQQQNNDILVVPIQFGLRHRGRSVRRAREVFTDNEFGLGTFEVACMLLTHPEREVQQKQLDIDCAGDELNENQFNNKHSRRMIFYSQDGKIRSDTELLKIACSYNGSASAFLFQQSVLEI